MGRPSRPKNLFLITCEGGIEFIVEMQLVGILLYEKKPSIEKRRLDRGEGLEIRGRAVACSEDANKQDGFFHIKTVRRITEDDMPVHMGMKWKSSIFDKIISGKF